MEAQQRLTYTYTYIYNVLYTLLYWHGIYDRNRADRRMVRRGRDPWSSVSGCV